MDTRPLFYVCALGFIHSFCWGEQCVVYHAESGDTHALNKVDLNVLQRINEIPVSAKDLAIEFESIFDDGAAQYIQTLLSNLAELDLIEIAHNESPH